MSISIQPFRDGDVHATFQNLTRKVTEEINSLDNEYILKASLTELEDYYVQKVIVEPIILQTKQLYIESRTGTKVDVTNEFIRGIFEDEGRVYVQGTKLDIAIPFNGDPMLWRIRPSSFSLSGYPTIKVRDDSIILSFSFPDDSANAESLKKEIDRDIKRLAEAIQNQRLNVDNHNRSAPQIIRATLNRKRKLSESTIGAVAELGIPMKRREQPLTYIVSTNRRELPVKRPKVPTEPYNLEPALDESEYKHILEVMRSMSVVIERNPKAFASLGEEDIRTHFLLQLNGHYEGGATAETFNSSGKTDILIRAGDRNIFIAECKFWKGPKAFNEAIDQLLGYLSWRDTKCALLIFNKNKDSTAVRQKMQEQMEARSEHRRTIIHDPDGDSRYILVKQSDPGREIILTTQIYDVPT